MFIIACPSLSVTNRPQKGRGQGHVANSKILHALNHGMAEVRVARFRVVVGYIKC